MKTKQEWLRLRLRLRKMKTDYKWQNMKKLRKFFEMCYAQYSSFISHIRSYLGLFTSHATHVLRIQLNGIIP